MYAIIAISCLCQEESLKGLKDERHSTPFNEAWDKNFGAMAPAPLSFKTRGGGGGGWGVSHTRTEPGRPPGPIAARLHACVPYRSPQTIPMHP